MFDAAFSSKRMDWATPRMLADACKYYYDLRLDVAASPHNAVCERWYGEQQDGTFHDGLKASWKGERCWMNPPYGRAIKQWVKKASESEAAIVVGLVPARTDTAWWHDYCLGKVHSGRAEIQYMRGRITFEGAKHPAPFPSAIIIWRPRGPSGLG